MDASKSDSAKPDADSLLGDVHTIDMLGSLAIWLNDAINLYPFGVVGKDLSVGIVGSASCFADLHNGRRNETKGDV